MMDIRTIEGDFSSGRGKYALVVGRWNSFVVEHLSLIHISEPTRPY